MAHLREARPHAPCATYRQSTLLYMISLNKEKLKTKIKTKNCLGYLC